MNKKSYIFSICFWAIITAYVLFVCSALVGYYYCFAPSLCAGVLSSVVLPLFIKKCNNNMRIATFVSIALHVVALAVSVLLFGFSRYSTYADIETYLLLIALPAVLSLLASLVISYLVLRMDNIKDFFYYHDKLLVVTVILLILMVLAILAIQPFGKIFSVLLPF